MCRFQVHQNPPGAVGADGDQAGEQRRGVGRLVHVNPLQRGERQPPHLTVAYGGPRCWRIQVRGRHPQVQVLVTEVSRDHGGRDPSLQRQRVGKIAQAAVQQSGGRLVRPGPQRGFGQRRPSGRREDPAAEGALPQLLAALAAQGGQDPGGEERGCGELVWVAEVPGVQESPGGGTVGAGGRPGPAGLTGMARPAPVAVLAGGLVPGSAGSPGPACRGAGVHAGAAILARRSGDGIFFPGSRFPGPGVLPGAAAFPTLLVFSGPTVLIATAMFPASAVLPRPAMCPGAVGRNVPPGLPTRLARPPWTDCPARARPRCRARERPGACAAPSRAGSGWRW